MIRGTTRVAAVIGWPVEHSRSPQMFEAAFAEAGLDAVMIPIGVPPESFSQVIAALRAMHAFGASVTLPHKLAAAALCDELSEAARAVGAVNCLRFTGGHLVGHNTDCHGFTDGLASAGFEAEGKRCVILGAGGAARAVAYGLRVAEAGAIDIIARRPQRVAWTTARPWTTVDLRSSFSRADLVVDATPMGLDDSDTSSIDALPLDALRKDAWIATLVYHRKTVLLERAQQRGYATLDGRGMLVHQGARAFAHWTGMLPPIQAMQRALDAALAGT
ncbi:MAG TPA: shikimate dehydrogenase [Kofleriaceae bacterium]